MPSGYVTTSGPASGSTSSRIARRAARIGLAAAVALIVLTLFRLHLQLRTFLDPAEAITADLVKATLGTTWGRGWLSQAAIAVLATLAFGWALVGGRPGWVLAHAGKRAETEQLLAQLERRASGGYVSPVAFALLHLALGDHAKALDWAERTYTERRGWLAYLKVNPLLDPLRSEPRFQALVQKLRL